MQPRAMGEPIDLPEVPVSMVMQDFVCFAVNYGSPFLAGGSPPSRVEEIWQSQFGDLIEPVLATPGARLSTCAVVAGELRPAEARA